MFLFLLLVLVLVHSSISVNFNSNYNITSNNGDGDLMYIFATTWTPEFCYNEVILHFCYYNQLLIL